jgi:hypothetical protein
MNNNIQLSLTPIATNKIMEIQKEIQIAFNELDWDQVFLLRDKLAYCTKFQDLAYASKKD